jgi:hypothetical protein
LRGEAKKLLTFVRAEPREHGAAVFDVGTAQPSCQALAARRECDANDAAFRTVQIDQSHTRVTWTYSFRLKDDEFPGEIGALGEWLFRVGFLDREYAAMMRGVLKGYKTAAETPSGRAGAATYLLRGVY